MKKQQQQQQQQQDTLFQIHTHTHPHTLASRRNSIFGKKTDLRHQPQKATFSPPFLLSFLLNFLCVVVLRYFWFFLDVLGSWQEC
jgi:hypothetical protein